MNEILQKFVETFVRKEKQDRLLTLLGNAKRRSDGLWELLHDGRNFDHTKFTLIEKHQIDTVQMVLRQRGATGMAYVIETFSDDDCREADLSQVLEEYLGTRCDVAVYFPKLNVGYYGNHEGNAYIFSAKP